MAETLFNDLGGMPCLNRVHKLLYDKLLRHPWLKGFFEGKERWHLESQQSEFMAGIFGGPKIYGGRMPKSAHVHMFVTEEVFQVRHQLLARSLSEAGVPDDLKERWLRYDMGMKRGLVKGSIDQCEGRFRTDPIVAVEKPVTV